MRNRIFNESLQVFDKQSFANWEKEIEGLPSEIEHSHLDVQSLQKQLQVEQDKLERFIQEELTPAQTRVRGLNARIKVLTLPASITATKQQLETHQKALKNLESQLTQVKTVLAPIDVDIERLLNGIEIVEAQAKIKGLHETVIASRSTLDTLKTNAEINRTVLIDVTSRLSMVQSDLSSLKMQETRDHALNPDDGYYSTENHPTGYSSSVGSQHSIDDNLRASQIRNLEIESQTLSNNKVKLEKERAEIQSQISSQRTDKSNAKNDIETLETRIHSLQDQGFKGVLSVEKAKQQLKSKYEEKKPHEIEKSKLIDATNFQLAESNRLKKIIDQLQNEFKDNQPLQTAYINNNSIDDLNTKLKQEESNLDQLQLLNSISNDAILKLKESLQNENDTHSFLVNRQNLLWSKQFLSILHRDPDLLLKQLADAMKCQLALYEKNHPANQPVNARLSLANATFKIYFIQDQLSQLLYAGLPEQTRQVYYQLCGFLWTLLNKNSNDPEFSNYFQDIIKLHPFDKKEAIENYRLLQSYYKFYQPNDMTDENYRFLQSYYNAYQLHDMTEEELNKVELTDYDYASKSFDQALKEKPAHASKEVNQLYKNGKELLSSIDHEKKSADKKNLSFDLKYHTTLIINATLLLKNPSNKVLQDDFHQVISHNTKGKPSLGKKIAGAAFMFFGAALITAGLVLKFLSLGLGSPITLPMIGGGGVIFAGGLTLFANGRHKSPDIQLTNFEKSASKVQEMSEKQEVNVPAMSPVLSR